MVARDAAAKVPPIRNGNGGTVCTRRVCARYGALHQPFALINWQAGRQSLGDQKRHLDAFSRPRLLLQSVITPSEAL